MIAHIFPNTVWVVINSEGKQLDLAVYLDT